MDDDLLRVARQVLERAEKRRIEYVATTERAVREIQIPRPDVTAAAALSALNVARRG
jgi:hypothetical protein